MITYTFLAIILVFSIYCFVVPDAMNKYLFYPYLIKRQNEHYRFLTHGFIHANYLHLGFNFLALYSFGFALEEQLYPAYFGEKMGKVYYIILFTGGIYASSVTEYFRHRDNPSYTSLGASGAISSVLFSFIIMSPLTEVFFLFLPLKGWIAGLLLIGVSYFLIRKKRTSDYNDGISHESHYAGAIFGVVFTLILKPELAIQFVKMIKNSF